MTNNEKEHDNLYLFGQRSVILSETFGTETNIAFDALTSSDCFASCVLAVSSFCGVANKMIRAIIANISSQV